MVLAGGPAIRLDEMVGNLRQTMGKRGLFDDIASRILPNFLNIELSANRALTIAPGR